MPNYNYFPVGYQQYPYMQNQPQFPIQPTQSSNMGNTGVNGIIWVQGEAGAKSYLVAPNTTVQLWDSESQTIYLKSADAAGMPSIKTLDYTIRDNNQPIPQIVQPDMSQYVTWADLDKKLNSLKQRPMQRKENRDE